MPDGEFQRGIDGGDRQRGYVDAAIPQAGIAVVEQFDLRVP